MKQTEPNDKNGNKWMFLALFIIGLVIVSNILAWIASSEEQSFGNVALISVNGVIALDSSQALMSTPTIGSDELIASIKSADKNELVKALLIEINSPGGSPVASKELADAVLNTIKPTYCLIREVGASGGYWVASACDKIVANEMSITGSIGVISSYLDVSGLLKDYNITYQRLVAGRYKDIGTPYKPLYADERELLEEQMDEIHDIFIKSVAKNRGLPELEIRKIATGMFFLGSRAKEYGLVDVLGGKDTVEELMKTELNLTEINYLDFRQKQSWLSSLTGVVSEQSFAVGRGIGSQIVEESAYSTINVRT